MPEYKLSCNKCGSSDALTDYGSYTHCYAAGCGDHVFKNNNKENNITNDTIKEVEANDSNNAKFNSNNFNRTSFLSQQLINHKSFKAIEERKISKATCEKYGVAVNEKNEQVYPYYDRAGHHIANKYRRTPKGFMTQGDINSATLFGQQLFPAGSSRQITITEGEIDCLSAFEMSDSRYPVVSVKSASTAERDCANSFEYLNSFETIVICFDKDEAHHKPDGTSFYPGQEAAQKVASLFPLGKVRILTLSKAKDANDYIKNGWSKEFKDEWWKAPTWTPEGLKYAKDMWDDVKREKNYETILYPWNGLNDLTYGIRLGELITFTADTGVGKTQILREIVFSALANTDKGLGLIFLEESNQDSLLGIMSIAANKPLHLPDVRAEVTEEELHAYFQSTCDNDRIILWDHFGSNDVSGVLSKIRHMAALGCKYIVLDHLSIVVSDQSGDERKQLDEISTKLKTLCMELNVAVITVIHQNRKGEIRGTAGVEQLSNIVVKLYRDKEDADEWRRNVTKVVVQKNRFCGRTGPACYLFYDSASGRLSELSDIEVKQFEANAHKETMESWS